VTVTKKRKPESATCYAIRRKSDGKWKLDLGEYGTMPRAWFLGTRSEASLWVEKGDYIQPCRVRPLPSAKRNRTRTR